MLHSKALPITTAIPQRARSPTAEGAVHLLRCRQDWQVNASILRVRESRVDLFRKAGPSVGAHVTKAVPRIGTALCGSGGDVENDLDPLRRHVQRFTDASEFVEHRDGDGVREVVDVLLVLRFLDVEEMEFGLERFVGRPQCEH